MFVEIKSILLATCAFFTIVNGSPNRYVVRGTKVEPLDSGDSDDSFSSSSSAEGDLKVWQLDQVARLLNAFYQTVHESLERIKK